MEDVNISSDEMKKFRHKQIICRMGTAVSGALCFVFYSLLQDPGLRVNSLIASLTSLLYIVCAVVTGMATFVFAGLLVIVEINKPKR